MSCNEACQRCVDRGSPDPKCNPMGCTVSFGPPKTIGFYVERDEFAALLARVAILEEKVGHPPAFVFGRGPHPAGDKVCPDCGPAECMEKLAQRCDPPPQPTKKVKLREGPEAR